MYLNEKKIRASSLVLPLLWFGVADHASIARAQSPGIFTATGNMMMPRVGHTATLLTNGKVLIAGGQQLIFTGAAASWVLLASAELYDPSTGTFAATGDMTTARSSHRATLLPDGRVFISGGISLRYGSLDSAEIYDPSTAMFAPAGKMTTGRFGQTATLLKNGKVLIVGGSNFANQSYSLIASAELYDPSTGEFTASGKLIKPKWLRTATLLTNGKVLIDGEIDNDEPSAESYDPDTSTFSLTGGTVSNDSAFAATASLLMNGKVLVTLQHPHDPYDADVGSDEAELYDPSTGTFTATGRLATLRWDSSTATLLPDGTVLIAGREFGAAPGGELYDPATGTFSHTENTPAASGRLRHTATLLLDGTVFLAGGESWTIGGYLAPLGTAEIYHPAVLVPAPVLLTLPQGSQHQGAILHADTHQVVSGSNAAVAEEGLEIYCEGLDDQSSIPPQIAIGGQMAEILFFGKTPGFAGRNQVNARVPRGVTPGPAVLVRLTYLGRPSNEVTIAVR